MVCLLHVHQPICVLSWASLRACSPSVLGLYFIELLLCVVSIPWLFDEVCDSSFKFCILGLISVILIDKHFHRPGRLWRRRDWLEFSYCLYLFTCELLLLVLCLMWIEQAGAEERLYGQTGPRAWDVAHVGMKSGGQEWLGWCAGCSCWSKPEVWE